MKPRVLLPLFACVALAVAAGEAETKKLRESLKDTDLAGPWVYNDLEEGFRQAKASGKPVLAIFRCVKTADKGLDGTVVRREDKDLAALMDQFVCVRMVEAWGMDLATVQFDMNLSWSVLCFNADRTVYARFGTKSMPRSTETTVAGLKAALQGVLDLHKAYPGNRKDLAGKQAPKPAVALSQQFPALKNYTGSLATTRNCLHCHQLHEAEAEALRDKGQPSPDRLLWSYPMPDLLGLALSPDERALVKAVTADSEGAKAGFLEGDRILRMAGQPVLSVADVQWALQIAPEPGSVKAEVDRGGKVETLTLELPSGWRRRGDFGWRASSVGLSVAAAGFWTRPLSPDDRQKLGVAADRLALQVFVPKKPDRPQPLLKGDVLVKVDGKDAALSPGEFVALLYRKKHGDRLALTLLRAGTRTDLDYPLR